MKNEMEQQVMDLENTGSGQVAPPEATGEQIAPETVPAPGETTEPAPTPEETPAPTEEVTNNDEQLNKIMQEVAGGQQMTPRDLIVNFFYPYWKKSQKINKEWLMVFNQYPELTQFVADLKNGIPPEVALAKNFDVESMKPIEGDENEPAYQEALSSYRQQRDERMKTQSEIDANAEASVKEIEGYLTDAGYPDEEAEKIVNAILEWVKNLTMWKIDKSTIDRIVKLMNYDTNMAQAETKGEIRGRNSKIVEKKAKELTDQGDGLPAMVAAGENTGKTKEKQDDFVQGLKRLTMKKPIIS